MINMTKSNMEHNQVYALYHNSYRIFDNPDNNVDEEKQRKQNINHAQNIHKLCSTYWCSSVI